MKCDRLEKWYAGQCSPSCVVYDANEVDAAIAELKVRNVMFHDEAKYYKAENEQLKAKLERVQASAYADSVDAGMRERMLRRALWLTRAERAHLKVLEYWPDYCHNAHCRIAEQKWDKVERKCLAMAEKFK